MAELSSQSVDVTRELVMWRDVQTREMQHEQIVQQVTNSRQSFILQLELEKVGIPVKLYFWTNCYW